MTPGSGDGSSPCEAEEENPADPGLPFYLTYLPTYLAERGVKGSVPPPNDTQAVDQGLIPYGWAFVSTMVNDEQPLPTFCFPPSMPEKKMVNAWQVDGRTGPTEGWWKMGWKEMGDRDSPGLPSLTADQSR
ncbi:hypothetical protein L249_8587 [Ophiocordyceps polyrhachis-furcata BCC 54312]|uniref:Uncharacterized protein n=1 Tax=Ophiocordyceps polyrhachis-furcata BCC 54312 TaxID=1330021 RepID=A0A367L6C1_9HYPO|nr:hypothetical protein L249_8587 [Ophiocordyceps polyrhachis-furcata BCC 54312]